MKPEFIDFITQFAATESGKEEIRRRLSKEDELQPVLDELDKKCNNFGRKLQRLMELVQALELHPKTFGKYIGAYAGRDIVLVDTGPSLKKYQPVEGAIHIGTDHAFACAPKELDFLFIQDTSAFPDGLAAANAYLPEQCHKFYGVASYGDDGEFAAKRVKFYDAHAAGAGQYIVEGNYLGSWIIDMSRMPIPEHGSVVFSALLFALYTLPRRIYLVGVDCSERSFFYRPPQSIDGRQLDIAARWKEFAPYADYYYPTTKIISINPVGLRGLFEDWDQG